MGTITLTPPVAGQNVVAGTIATAFSALQTLLNGNLDAANLAASVLAGTVKDYKQITANVSVTATTEGTANTIITGNSATYDGTLVKVEFFAPRVSLPSFNPLTIVLLRGATVLGQAQASPGTQENIAFPFKVEVFDTPASGSHTYSVKAFVAAGTGTVVAGLGGSGAFLPAFLRTTKA